MVVVGLRIRATTPVEEEFADQIAQEIVAEAVVPDQALVRLLQEGKDALAKGQNDIALARFREHARLSHVPTEIVDGMLTAATGLEKARGAAEWARHNNQNAKKGVEDRRRAFEQALEMARKDMVADNLVAARGALRRRRRAALALLLWGLRSGRGGGRSDGRSGGRSGGCRCSGCRVRERGCLGFGLPSAFRHCCGRAKR
jgi:hypothetical protein